MYLYYQTFYRYRLSIHCRHAVHCVFELARPIFVMILLFCLFKLILLFVFLLQTRTVTGPEYERNRMILETRRSYRRTKVRHNRLCRTHKITFHLQWFSYSSYAFSRVQSAQKKSIMHQYYNAIMLGKTFTV